MQITSPFQNCSGNILITYCFSGEERNIKPCKNVYESTKDETQKKLNRKTDRRVQPMM